MAGLTNEGLVIKRLEEVINDRVTSARTQFGNDIGTSVNDVLGRLLRITAASEADLWETSEAVYNSFNPDYATGAALDRIVAYAGLTRYLPAASKTTLVVAGDYLATIPQGSIVRSSKTTNSFLTDTPRIFDTKTVSGFVFEPISLVEAAEYSVTVGAEIHTYTSVVGDTLENIAEALKNSIDTSSSYSATRNGLRVEVTFDDIFVTRDIDKTSNITFRRITKTVTASNDTYGPVTQPADTLDIVATPSLGWDYVNNPLAASPGRFRETDIELRNRFANSKELNAKGNIDSIYSNLTSLIGVEQIQVYENYTSVLDGNNFPPKSFSVVALGGNTQEIAETIWSVKPAGIESFGNTTVTVKDVQGNSHQISFSRPNPIRIYIQIEVSKSEGGVIAANVDTTISDAVAKYFSDNWSVGDDIIYSRLYTPVNAGNGYQVDTLLIGTDPTLLGTNNIVIGFDEIASIRKQDIEIIVNT